MPYVVPHPQFLYKKLGCKSDSCITLLKLTTLG
jgi:hypothetical protein